MQVFQTAGDPPSKGNNILPNIGCTLNINPALMNKVMENKNISEKLRYEGGFMG
jgi:hypothetical protein